MPTILCVDDNRKTLRMLSSLFHVCGFSVLTAEDPADALTLVKAMQFDLAVLDYDMPGLTGTAFAQELRRIKPKVPILLHSGSLSLPEAELDAVDACSAKGESVDSFLRKVRDLLAIGTNRA
jgi:two-component system, cell cycle sensor histidine kinase and response regulator CckA